MGLDSRAASGSKATIPNKSGRYRGVGVSFGVSFGALTRLGGRGRSAKLLACRDRGRGWSRRCFCWFARSCSDFALTFWSFWPPRCQNGAPKVLTKSEQYRTRPKSTSSTTPRPDKDRPGHLARFLLSVKRAFCILFCWLGPGSGHEMALVYRPDFRFILHLFLTPTRWEGSLALVWPRTGPRRPKLKL